MTAEQSGLPRRHLLIGGAAAGTGALTAAMLGSTLADRKDPAAGSGLTFNGDFRQPFHAARQSGIETQAQAHASFLALKLNKGLRADGMRRLLTLLSNDAQELAQGRAALADMEGELAEKPANLTITFGFGPGFFQALGKPIPDSAQPLPAFGIDRLQAEYSGGDLLLQVCCDDLLTLAHAQRMLLKDAKSFSTLQWNQTGFRRSYNTEGPEATPRNLFGQLDGTGNSTAGTGERERIIWGDQQIPAWHPDGTSLV